MKRLPLALSIFCISALGACGGSGGPDPGDDQVPWRTAWETVIDGAVLPGECPAGSLGCPCGTGSTCDGGSCLATDDGDFCFGQEPAGTKGGLCDNGSCAPGLICTNIPDLGESGCADPVGDEVTSLDIGGLAVDENFHNRGDVEVFFTGDEGKITVQMRKFTFAADEEGARENWDRLEPWAYSSGVVPPGPDNAEDDCSEAFRNGCQIRVWYNGQIQPQRDGADIRVILPGSFQGELNIVTEDNIAEADNYPDRGDVTIKNLKGEANIELDSGNVEVSLHKDILEAPECGPELVEACENWEDPDTMEPAPWDVQACGCAEFGKVKVDSRPERATNVTIDMPGDLWATATLENKQAGLTKDSDPLCTAEVDCDGLGACNDIKFDDAFPWKRTTEINDPGDSALEGVGYGFNVNSEACQNVAFVSDPEDWGSEPGIETRGNLLVCNGCTDIAAP